MTRKPIVRSVAGRCRTLDQKSGTMGVLVVLSILIVMIIIGLYVTNTNDRMGTE